MLNILLFGTRRRIFFIEQLKKYLFAENIKHTLIYADTDMMDPARFHVDKYILLPNSTTDRFEETLLKAVNDLKINLIIPWLDRDILAFTSIRERLRLLGAELALPSNHVVNLFNDKFLTAGWLKELGLPAPKTLLISKDAPPSIEAMEALQYPLFVKPRFGQGSVGIAKINSQADLKLWLADINTDYVMQEYIQGEEFTVEVCQKEHQIIFISPRKRLKIRGGECLISKIEIQPEITKLAEQISKTINIQGIYNFQVFLLNDRELKLIEFNPRFGGGSDLTIQAGGNIPQALLNLHLGLGSLEPQPIQNHMVMTRYHSSEFFLER